MQHPITRARLRWQRTPLGATRFSVPWSHLSGGSNLNQSEDGVRKSSDSTLCQGSDYVR